MRTFTLRTLCLSAFLFLIATGALHAQGDGTGLNTSYRISEIHIAFDSDTISVADQKQLRSSILSKLHIFPNALVHRSTIDFAVSRVQAIPEVAAVSYTLDLGTGASYILRLVVSVQKGRMLVDKASGIFTKNAAGSFPYLYRSNRFIAKLDLGVSASVVGQENTWLNNGEFFTEFSPFGNNYPENGQFVGFEYALTAGITLLYRMGKNTYIYGNYKELFVQTVGQGLFTKNNPYSIGRENLYGGIVGSIPTAKGNEFTYNISAGMQPYRIGTGMLLCQIAGNGGVRGGLNIWPRFSGDFVGLVQARYDNLKGELFFVDPNEFGGFETNTRLAGINLEYALRPTISVGFTYLRALRSTFLVLLPDGTPETREGLNAYHLRGEWHGKENANSLFAKAEGGIQNNSRFPSLAWGMAAELGYKFETAKLKPSFSYRFAHLSGDNPETETYERWDLLYSGNDVETWVQGLLMKNILFNTNMQTHRLQVQMIVSRWRLTAQYHYIRSDQLNNLPQSPIFFASQELAHHMTILAEKSFWKHFYTRISLIGMWASNGLNDALPTANNSPWLGFQAMVMYHF
jgi:hypothetical protein